jgi:hypothetical protein
MLQLQMYFCWLQPRVELARLQLASLSGYSGHRVALDKVKHTFAASLAAWFQQGFNKTAAAEVTRLCSTGNVSAQCVLALRQCNLRLTVYVWMLATGVQVAQGWVEHGCTRGLLSNSLCWLQIAFDRMSAAESAQGADSSLT